MSTDLRPGWDPEPSLASSQHQERDRQRAAGLPGLSERQQNRTGEGLGTGAGLRYVPNIARQKKKLRIVMQAILGEEAQHILNPHYLSDKAKYFLISKHN